MHGISRPASVWRCTLRRISLNMSRPKHRDRSDLLRSSQAEAAEWGCSVVRRKEFADVKFIAEAQVKWSNGIRSARDPFFDPGSWVLAGPRTVTLGPCPFSITWIS